MILRSVMTHVKHQNWVAVGLDFIIVILGVFIGIQVANWNVSLKDRRDEWAFLEQLHEDIETADALSRRVRTRRLDKLDWLSGAMDVLFGDDENAVLNADECIGVASSHYYNINAVELPAYTELVSSGRLGIIRDARLRSALVAFQQARNSLIFYTGHQALGVHDLPSKYPSLIRLKSYYDEALLEIQPSPECEVAGMRKDISFLNELSENMDRYDGYVRDGLRPWSDQFDVVHRLVDEALDLHHDEREVVETPL